jgi:hypothetical protein
MLGLDADKGTSIGPQDKSLDGYVDLSHWIEIVNNTVQRYLKSRDSHDDRHEEAYSSDGQRDDITSSNDSCRSAEIRSVEENGEIHI